MFYLGQRDESAHVELSELVDLGEDGLVAQAVVSGRCDAIRHIRLGALVLSHRCGNRVVFVVVVVVVVERRLEG